LYVEPGQASPAFAQQRERSGELRQRRDTQRGRKQKQAADRRVQQALVEAERGAGRKAECIHTLDLREQQIEQPLVRPHPVRPAYLQQVTRPGPVSRQQQGEHVKALTLEKPRHIPHGERRVGQAVRHEYRARRLPRGVGGQQKRTVTLDNPLVLPAAVEIGARLCHPPAGAVEVSGDGIAVVVETVIAVRGAVARRPLLRPGVGPQQFP
jgi:hypothetical protein